MNVKEFIETLVIGAGPSGLTFAYTLAKTNHPVGVLEHPDYVGGISRTVSLFVA
jgi:protoporphyrinogen oxidase